MPQTKTKPSSDIPVERTRYRVTGSLVLLALAVIFIPMLFDGAGVASQTEALPPFPQARTVAQDPELAEASQLPDYAAVAPSTDAAERVAELKAQVDEDGYRVADGGRFGTAALTLPTDETLIWAVQAASFGEADNALGFMEQLRDAGYEAFIATHKNSSGQVRHRVAVGPLLSKEEATAIQQKVSGAMTVEAQIMEMQP